EKKTRGVFLPNRCEPLSHGLDKDNARAGLERLIQACACTSDWTMFCLRIARHLDWQEPLYQYLDWDDPRSYRRYFDARA
ncbi:MAG: hypothetical protein AAGA78_17505, partial [Pseudomonadota bacterium]